MKFFKLRRSQSKSKVIPKATKSNVKFKGDKKITSLPCDIPTRILELAKPRKYAEPEIKLGLSIYCISIKAMEPRELNDRMEYLAKPRKIRREKIDKTKKSPFGISINALRYKPSRKLALLAKPKEYPKRKRAAGSYTRYGVSKWALSCANKASDRIVKLAKPRRVKNEPLPDLGVKKTALKYEATDRIVRLAKRKRYRKQKDTRKLTIYGVSLNALRGREISDRNLELAQPKKVKKIDEEEVELTPFGVSRNAMEYNASSRIGGLAAPKHIAIKQSARMPEVNPDITKFGVSLRALKGKASDRVLKLAAAKKYEDQDQEEAVTKFGVVQNALKYKTTDRIISLAKPKSVTEKFNANEEE